MRRQLFCILYLESIVSRILITTQGSLGDLFPYLALANILQAAGYEVTLAGPEAFAPYVSAENIDFVPLGPSTATLEEVTAATHTKGIQQGSNAFMQVMSKGTRADTERLLPHAEQAEILLNNFFALPGSIVAEVAEKPYLNVYLTPAGLLNPNRPPYIPAFKLLEQLWRLPVVGYSLTRTLLRQLMFKTQLKNYVRTRRAYGLPGERFPSLGDFSPFGNILLYSRRLENAEHPEVDVCQLPYPQYIQPVTDSAELERFCAYTREIEAQTGRGPVVATLGSTFAGEESGLYEQLRQGVELAGVELAIICSSQYQAAHPDTETCRHFSYLPYPQVFAAAALVLHQGGVGTCHDCLYAGAPQIIVTSAMDRADNGRQVERAGYGYLWLDQNPATLASYIRNLLPTTTELLPRPTKEDYEPLLELIDFYTP